MKRFTRGKQLLTGAMFLLLIGLLFVLLNPSRPSAPVLLTAQLVPKKDGYKEREQMDFELVFFNKGKNTMIVFPDPALFHPYARSAYHSGIYFETLGTGVHRKPFHDKPFHDLTNYEISGRVPSVPPGKEYRKTIPLDNFIMPPPPGDYRIPYTIAAACCFLAPCEEQEFRTWRRDRLGSLPLVGKYLEDYFNDRFDGVVSEGELVFSVRPASSGKSDK